ncbi:MAG: hypothetical protein ACOCP4_04615 [Candidatus Woesearchaeota archaeon]
MKQALILYILLLIGGCVPNNPNCSYSSSNNSETRQTTYEFKYDELAVSFQGKTQKRDINGRLVLYNDEIHVFKGSKGEKFFINDIQKNDEQLVIHAENNKKDEAIFKIAETKNKSTVEVDLEGVLMIFKITSGDISEIELYSKTDDSVKDFQNSKSINYCDCQKIHRDDGAEITQCISLPVANDSGLELGMAVASNGLNCFITLTIRFLKVSAKEINGNLAIRLKDNNLITVELVNKELAKIGDSQVSQAIFSLDNDDINKLMSSKLLTISLQLNNLMHTLECNSNTAILKEQLICLTKRK